MFCEGILPDHDHRRPWSNANSGGKHLWCTFNIFQTHAIPIWFMSWTIVGLHHEAITIRLIIWPRPDLSLHSPPLLPNPPFIQWITPVAASSGWINESKPWMWLKGKQSLAFNSDKRQGLAWQERKGYSLYTIVMATTYKRINGRWSALCLGVCAYVCTTYQSVLSSTVTLHLASVSHTLAHKQSAKTKPSFTLEMYFKVFKVSVWAAVLWALGFLFSLPHFLWSEQICTECTRILQQKCSLVDHQP